MVDKLILADVLTSTTGIFALITFVIAYLLVIGEEFLHLKKSKPVVLASGLIWLLVAITAKQQDSLHLAETALEHYILDYAKLFLFLLVAMTYVNAMQERRVFDALRGWLVSRGFTLKKLFWVTGILAFFISPIADNLTTALIMGAVIMAVGKNYKTFVALGCINVVVAANAGGAFSPFGDITTLMVWQSEKVPFQDFFHIFIPSVVSFIIPAFIMSFAVPNVKPRAIDEHITMEPGAKLIMFLFLITIAMAVCFHSYLGMPPVLGMMTGLGFLKFHGYYLQLRHSDESKPPFDIIKKIEQAEWDTLLFFYGVILCVGGLATFGYLEGVSSTMYDNWGAMTANIAVGIISAIIDNIPVMFAVLTMDPTMSKGHWLLVTLTAGIGGSLLSVGSAAGVALMGQARGIYTFFSHLKWSWAIAVGYAAGVAVHIWLNSGFF